MKLFHGDKGQAAPVLLIFSPEDKHLHDLLYQILQGCLVLPIRTVVVNHDQRPDLPEHAASKITWISPEKNELDEWLLAADMALLFKEHHQIIDHLLKKGVIPVAKEQSPLLVNYDAIKEIGNSFTFSSYNPWDMFAALVRARETYTFPFDWQHILRGMLKVR